MGFFSQLLIERDLSKHYGKPLWNYNLSEFEFLQLKAELNQVRFFNLDARDAALYFAEWWKRNYNGGIPSKQEVFNSLGREESKVITDVVFYEKARSGAQMLGIKWIQKQNTLYFRTLLLQGGIPIKHVAENKNYYKAFLLALLEKKPSTIEDIASESDLTKLLPISSRNETVYENCLAIVNSILNDEDTYSVLFEGNSSLKEIQTALQVRKHQLSKVARVQRPKVFWVMTIEESIVKIKLRMGFSSKYSETSLAEILNLSQPAQERTYHLYLDEILICAFRKTLGGDYKTEWENQNYVRWNAAGLSPQFYCVCNDERWEIVDLIPVHPSIDVPTLWTAFSENEWRLVKGNASNSENAILLLPIGWEHSNEESELVYIVNHPSNAIRFQGKITVSKADLVCKYFSNVDAFEWNIKTEKPSWMRKADVAIVTRQLSLNVYDNEGKILAPNKYKVYFRSAGSSNLWQLSDGRNQLPIGLLDVKIECNDIKAYDTAYNIADLKLDINEQKLDCAMLKWNNLNSFSISVSESNKFSATSYNNCFRLQLSTEQLSVPDSIPFRLKYRNQKALYFDIPTPFSGIGLVDKDGILLNEGANLTLNDLHGIRILTTNAGETNVKFWNKLRVQVKILKTIHFSHQPLISFKEELQRLFYLADAMRHDNLVTIEISNGRLKRSYCVKRFSYSINDVSTQFERKIMMMGGTDHMQLFAVPLNCKSDDIQLVPMQMDADKYHHLPKSTAVQQFIIISEISNGKQLQPRFINTDPAYIGKSSTERISQYQSLLLGSDHSSLPWNELQSYYKICLQQKIPFSTFDQIRAIGRNSKLAARAFFFLGINQEDSDEFIQRHIPSLEQDLGFCFHWIGKDDWEDALGAAEKWVGQGYVSNILTLLGKHFQEENLNALYQYISGQKIPRIVWINNQVINDARAKLGERVLNELPTHTPQTSNDYGVPIASNHMVKLLLRAPIAVAESIKGIAVKSIWEDNDFVSNLRRNIQYAHFIAPDLYIKVLYHCLSQSK